MNNARNQLWTYLNTHNNDELQRTDIIVMLKQIEKEQAAAVAAEREACAKVATKAIMHVNTSTARSRDWTMAELKGYCSGAAEKAIRARNGGKGE